MWYKPFGKTGKEISVVGFGGMRFEKPSDLDTSAETVLHAYAKGINYFDTAPGYCDSKSEEIIGTAVTHMKPGTFYVSTKSNKSDGGALRKDLEQSLRRLKVEKLDFFHIWWVLSLDAWRQRVAGGAVEAAFKAKEEGLIDHVMLSSHMPSDELKQTLTEAPFEGVTLGYCAINFPFREEAVNYAGENGLGVVTMNPLGGGTIPQNPERFEFLKGPQDRSVVEAAIRFNVSNPHITAALVGFGNKAHVDEAAEAVRDFRPYAPAHVEAIRSKVMTSFNGLCTGCGYCLPCPAGVAIPKMMDAYNQRMLSNGGGTDAVMGRLKWHWGLEAQAANACTQCGLCEQRCTQRLAIRERLSDITAMGENKG
jgi:predicted aldo/keto reductase-like oxidoreductase